MDDYRSRLIAARERLGLSRSQMAERLMTPIATYKQWEDGSRRTPGIAVVAAEAKITRRRQQKKRNIIAAMGRGRTNADIARITGATQDTVRAVLRKAGLKAAPAPMGANSHRR